MGQQRFWRLEDPVIDENYRVIKGGMFEPQRRFWLSQAFIKCLITGYGGGKTMIGCKRAIANALHNSPAPHLMVSPSYKMARRTTIPTLEALLHGKAKLTGLRWDHNKSHHEFTLGLRGRIGRIWVASGNDPDSLKGPNVGSASIDEPFIQDEQVFREVNARVRDTVARNREICLLGTPEELNWGYDICEGELREHYDLEYIQASTRENKALDPSYIRHLSKAFTNEAGEAYIEGKFVNLQTGRVLYAFSDDNVADLPDPGSQLCVGMDFNVDPMAAIVFWVNGEHVHVMDEIEIPNADTYYMCQYIIDKYVDKEGKCRVTEVFPDPTGRARKTSSPAGASDFSIIRDFGFVIRSKSASFPRDRENAVNGKLRNKEGKRTLTISPKCKKLRSYMNKYTHKNKNTPEGKSMSHLVTALEYPIELLFPIKRIPIITKVQGA